MYVFQVENKFHYLDLHSIESPKPNKVGPVNLGESVTMSSMPKILPLSKPEISKKVAVSSDQEMEQSERNCLSKNKSGKKLN